jgi:ABC-2 type transport system permease protein
VSDLDGTSSQSDLFRASYASADEADRLLKSGDIAAYLIYDNELKMTVSGSGLDQTITKLFLDEYLKTDATIQSILKRYPDAAAEGLLTDLIYDKSDYLSEVPASSSGTPDSTVIYFYSLLAMACLMGSTVSIMEIIKLQANMSPFAARMNLAPASKFRVFVSNIAATVLFQLLVTEALLAYIALVLGIDFGPRIPYVLLTCVIGSICGIFFGTAVSVGFKSTGIKYAITIGTTMLSSFLAGMMAHEVKYLVSQHAPVISYLSPASLISDAFYSLYYYDDLSRYFLNLTILCVLSAVLCAITCLVLRRKSYASI